VKTKKQRGLGSKQEGRRGGLKTKKKREEKPLEIFFIQHFFFFLGGRVDKGGLAPYKENLC
jgi:hypothetical protein